MSTPDKIYVKPARPGLIVRDLQTHQPLPDDGAFKPDTPEWRRAIKQGDVVTAKPPSKASAKNTSEGE